MQGKGAHARAPAVDCSVSGICLYIAHKKSAAAGTVKKFLLSRQGEIEGRALANFTLGPDAPTVAVNNALYRGQADACSGEFFFPVQTLKGAEELIGVGHIEACAIVAHNEDFFFIYFR